MYSCLRNTVTTFHVIEREVAWRRERGVHEGFDALRAHRKPVVAVGADRTLDERTLFADYFRMYTFITGTCYLGEGEC